MAAVAAATAITGNKQQRGAAPRRLKYRAPMAMFLLTTPVMLLLSVLAYRTAPSVTDPTRLQMPQCVEDVKAIPYESRGFSFLLYGFYLVESLYSLALTLGMTFEVVQYICTAAWAAHALEAVYALRLCVRHRATIGTTLVYVVMVFIGGFPQLSPLKSAVRSLEKGASK